VGALSAPMPIDEDIVRLALGERDIDDLVAFLTSLTSGQW
jgi:hypothetical protein